MKQSTSLKIVSLNIEKDRHLDRIVPFLKKQQPDVVLLQEVFDKDIQYIENGTGMKSIFMVLDIMACNTGKAQLGMLTLSTLPIQKSYSAYYRGGPNPLFNTGGEPEIMPRGILVTELVKENQPYCLVNTHFTWSPKGKPSEQQYHDLPIFFELLSKFPEFILCGDFNAPRGTAIFDALSAKYKDNIPVEVHTTIDKNLHKSGDLGLVVDGLFTTPNYFVDSIQIVDGLSDHCAILATVNVARARTC